MLREKSNYKFFYESKGYNFILEDLIISSYVSWPTIILGVKDWVRTYIPISTLKKLHSEGLTHSELEIKLKFKKIQKIINYFKNVPLKNNFTNRQLLDIFVKLSRLLNLYSYFDISYSEGIYKNNPQDLRCVLIEKTKNVIRDDFDDIFFRENSLLEKLLKIISKKTKIDINEIRWYRFLELVKLLEDRQKLSLVKIFARKKIYIFDRDQNSEITFIVGAKAKSIRRELEQAQKLEGKILEGVVAHRKEKIIRGRVCVIHRDYSNYGKLMKDMDFMEEGAILVTTITDPEFMPAIKKAGAIITDVGGLLSHAAISAREFNISCIVGTKIATKVLKDGDLVEVDASKGVVKILRKK